MLKTIFIQLCELIEMIRIAEEILLACKNKGGADV